MQADINIKQDKYLKSLVKDLQQIAWKEIATAINKKFPHRDKKVCDLKIRWNELKPKKNNIKNKWPIQQQRKLYLLHFQYGPMWKKMTDQFPGLSDNDIKNHFFANTRKKLRQLIKLLGQNNSSQTIKKIKPSIMSKFLHKSSYKQFSLNLAQNDQILHFINFLIQFDNKKQCLEHQIILARKMINQIKKINQRKATSAQEEIDDLNNSKNFINNNQVSQINKIKNQRGYKVKNKQTSLNHQQLDSPQIQISKQNKQNMNYLKLNQQYDQSFPLNIEDLNGQYGEQNKNEIKNDEKIKQKIIFAQQNQFFPQYHEQIAFLRQQYNNLFQRTKMGEKRNIVLIDVIPPGCQLNQDIKQ